MQYARKSGILLHPTSLPGPEGIGTLGRDARLFLDFLHDAGQSVWQVLPLGPVTYGNSPYSCFSAFAGNPLLLDLDTIVAEGDIPREAADADLPAERIDFRRVGQHKMMALRQAAHNFLDGADQARRDEFRHFCDATSWLHDYALFMAVKNEFQGKEWGSWPDDIVRRRPDVLDEYSERLVQAVGEQKYIQWQFHRQWQALKRYANGLGIEILGDLPIFVSLDSADVWANPHLFHLDERGKPTVVAGVPPDYFSETGQLWGNPLYNWEVVAYRGYDWWIERMKCSLDMYDSVRIDHFRGFEAYWEVPAKEKTARNGRWVKGPGSDLFKALIDALGPLPVVAEDLGVITPDVEALRDSFGFPGMKILQFAFGSGPDNPYLPHNHVRECVVYTGTHDNDTTAGWFASLPEKERRTVLDYLACDGTNIARDMVRTALSSVAGTVVIPFQDILGLGNSARMNIPGTSSGNWSWRFTQGSLEEGRAACLRDMTERYGRLHQKRQQ
jgi:4-alpha-glucanotransferase